MKARSILLLSGLIIGLAFSVLLARLTSLERENARQREQVAVMRETTTQAREAFDRMQKTAPPEPVIAGFRSGPPSEGDFTRIDHGKAVSDLDAEIETLEIVSKEK